jgi:DNA-nicking Smr family endonuclease
MAKLKLDLHEIYNKGRKIGDELNCIMQGAMEKRIELVEIIPGKGSGQLKKHVLRFLNQSHIKSLYHRVQRMTAILVAFSFIFAITRQLNFDYAILFLSKLA